MNRPVVQARRGIALVITLIMLSVVTITAVAFLAVSRRERGAVNAQGEQIEARYAADSALNRVKAELTSRIHSSGNRSAIGLIVSTNYILSDGFDPSQSYAIATNRNFLTNVSYVLASGAAFNQDQYSRMLANLFYDPRPPVFVFTNANLSTAPDFRFYLDVNRNGRFETNGWQVARGDNDQSLGGPSQFMVGDPEWIGILERPNVPHSGTNRFGARFAYLVLPAGRAMDVNYLHNSVKSVGTNQLARSFMRDQGVGSWELNLAGFLTDLNTNAWPDTTANYSYHPRKSEFNDGQSFVDASQFLRARRQAPADANPSTATAFFRSEAGLEGADRALLYLKARTNGVDWFSDGMDGGLPVRTLADIRNYPLGDDSANNVWSGGDYNNTFTDFTQFLAPGLDGDLILQRKLAGTATGIYNENLNRTYDRYTFHRLLAQLGTDGSDARFESGLHSSLIRTNNNLSPSAPQYNRDGFFRRAKLNLNFRQEDPNGDRQTSASVAPFQDWRPLEWFTNASHRMVMTEFPYGLPRRLGNGDSLPGIAVTGFFTNGFTKVFPPTNSYSAQLHRLFQVSANIYDYTTNRTVDYRGNLGQVFPYLPSVFQPVLYRETNPQFDEKVIDPLVARIARFDAVTNNAVAVLRLPWVDLTDSDFTRVFAPGFSSDPTRVVLEGKNSAQDNLFGVNSLKRALYVGIPMVIGAKKGLPNFNEGLWQSSLRVTRRLFVEKAAATDKLELDKFPFGSTIKTKVQYRFQLTNHFAVEAWNSYSSNIYAQGLPRNVRLIATNVLSFGLYHDNSVEVLASAKTAALNLPVGSRLVSVGNYLVQGTNMDLGTTMADRWPADRFIQAMSSEVPFDFTYTPNGRTINIQNPAAANVTSDEFQVDLARPLLLHLYVTNRMMFGIVDLTTGAMLDYVNLKSVIAETNIMRVFGQGLNTAPVAGSDLVTKGGFIRMPLIWNTGFLRGNFGATLGMSNQMAASLGMVDVGPQLWTDPTGQPTDKKLAINGLYYFLYRQFPSDPNLRVSVDQTNSVVTQYGSRTRMQVGFNPSPTVFLTDRLQANDPLVHYVREDLAPGYTVFCDSGNYSEILGPGRRFTSETDGFQLTTNSVVDATGRSLEEKKDQRGVIAYSPWGRSARLQLKADNGITDNLYYKDSQITGSDAWAFPTNSQTKYPGIGFLGRVHRGTPWQTLYLKSPPLITNRVDGHDVMQFLGRGSASDRVTAVPSWSAWSGSPGTHPVDDWKFLDLFTTAINDNAGRGLMSVNQTNVASWSALLSGVSLLDTAGEVDSSSSVANPMPFEVRPNSPELKKILAGYTGPSGAPVPGLLAAMAGTNVENRFLKVPILPVVQGTAFAPGGTFTNLGSILSVPTLSDRAPFLFDHSVEANVLNQNMTDEVVERLPQQILSLLRADEPRVVVYSFGQSLKPALNSLITKPGTFYGLCTNYQITGEYVTKTTLRFDGSPGNLRTVVEDHRVLYPGN